MKRVDIPSTRSSVSLAGTVGVMPLTVRLYTPYSEDVRAGSITFRLSLVVYIPSSLWGLANRLYCAFSFSSRPCRMGQNTMQTPEMLPIMFNANALARSPLKNFLVDPFGVFTF